VVDVKSWDKKSSLFSEELIKSENITKQEINPFKSGLESEPVK